MLRGEQSPFTVECVAIRRTTGRAERPYPALGIPALQLVGGDVAEHEVPASRLGDPHRALDELHVARKFPHGGALRKQLLEGGLIDDLEVCRRRDQNGGEGSRMACRVIARALYHGDPGWDRRTNRHGAFVPVSAPRRTEAPAESTK